MTQLALPLDSPADDICRHRHGGNRRSEVANTRIGPHKVSQRERIRIFISGCGWSGATSEEIENTFGWAKNRFSGRLTELRASGEIIDSGRVRNGCTVWIAKAAL